MSETPKIPDWKNARSMDQPHFAFWMSSLTSEGLHAKADIARLLAMLTQSLSAAEQRAEAMGKEDTVESLGDWQYLTADNEWITCPDRAAAEREQNKYGVLVRYVRYYRAALASSAGKPANEKE